MKWILFLLGVHILLRTSEGVCEIEGLTDPWTNGEVDDTATLFGEYNTVGITGIRMDEGIGFEQYFQISFSESVLKIAPSDEFAKYEENTASGNGPHIINMRLSYTCDDGTGSILSFRQPIRDTNNHLPELSASSYNYKLPMPFPQGLDVTLLGDEIITKDIDITNTRINFKIEPAGDFIIDYDATIGDLNKEHRASLKATRPLRFTEARTYTITATDVGDPAESTTAELVITIDEDSSIPQSPFFTEAYHIVQYNTDPIHEIDDTVISLSDGSKADITLEGEYSEHFEALRGTNDVTITLKSNLPDEVLQTNTFVPLTVIASVDNAEHVGRTVLIVKLPIVEQTTTTSEPCPTTVTITTAEPCPPTPEITTCEPCATITTPVTCEPVTDCPTTTELDCSQCPTSTASSCEPCTTTPGEPAPCDMECCADICPPTDCPSTTTVADTTCSPEDCSEICTTITTCPPTDCTTTSVTASACGPEDCEEICTSTSTLTTPTTETCPPQDCSTTTVTDCSCGPDDCEEICTSTSTLTTPTMETCPPTDCSTTTVTDCSCGPDDCEEICTTTCTLTTPTMETCPPTDCSTTTVTDCSCGPDDCEEICTSTATLTTPTTETCAPTDCSPTTGTPCTPEDCQDVCSTTQAPCVTTETCPPQDCTQCPTSTTAEPPPSGNIAFGEAIYTISAKPLEPFGGVFTAIAVPEEDILYELTSSSGSLPAALLFNQQTAEISCTGLESNLYQFTITATGQTSGHTAHAGIIISIRSVEICNDEPRTAYSLYVTEVPENTEKMIYSKGLDTELDDYTYAIESVNPTAGADFFYIDEVTGDLHCRELDREWEGFAGMPNPQFTIYLKVVDINALPTPIDKSNIEHFKRLVFNNGNRDLEYRQCVYIENIHNRPSATVVSLIVTDENDQRPQFAEAKVIVGYPVKDLASFISPDYLLQVEATDADSGDNAVVKYSVDNRRVIIHSETGVIYPSDNMFEDDDEGFVFKVMAVDVSNEGTDLEVEVKFVEQDYISVLTLKNVLLEDMESVLQDILSEKTIQIKPLSASVLPMDVLSRTSRDTSDTTLVVTAYALSSSNELILTSELQEWLANVDGLTVTALPDECPPTDCTTTTTTTVNPSPSGNIQFDQNIYTIHAKPHEQFDGIFKATADPEEDILYDLTSSSGSLPPALIFEPTTAKLSSSGLESNLYQLTITATGQASGISAEAGIIISVQSAEICEDGARTSYSLYVTEVQENTEAMIYNKGANDELEGYTYEIESVYPTINEGLFYINDETGNLHCHELDREWTGFAGVLYPQFTIHLKLVEIDAQETPMYKSNIESFKNLIFNKYASRDTDYRQCSYVGNINNLPTSTVVSLMVTDDNDHIPEFAQVNIIVAYPVKDLASVISPAYLLQVKATDGDSGTNAVVKYSVDSDRVIIHSETGVIYPSDNVFEDDEDDFDFTVKAVDISGEGNALEVEVKFVEQDYISVLMLKNLLLEDMESKLEEILRLKMVEIRPFTASVLPEHALSRTSRDAPDTNLVITAYALSSRNELIKTSELEKLLDGVSGLTVSALPEYTQNQPPSDGSSNTGLIVAVSLLAVLLALAIIGFILFIYFRKRKTNKYSQMEENGSNEQKPSFSKNSKMDFGSKPDIKVQDRRPTGITFTQPVSDETDTDAFGTLKIDEELRERRKSVTFNSNIEQIDIEREAENEKTESAKL